MTASSVWLQSTKQSRTKHKDGTDAFCGQSLFVVISNLPRRPYLRILMEMQMEIEGYVFFSLFLSHKKGLPAKSVSPFIMPMY